MPRGEGIKPINNLFEKYKNLLRPPQASVIKVFVEVVEEVMAITIDPEQVTYNVHNKTINLTTPSVVKSEIKRRQTEILNHLKGRLGEQSAPTTIL